ncbi:hypothetical protein D9758_008156 [Tetrapyrgos nigripes]|uniref:Uncharacterized protein n=1 Tax=Tetrapyrgos nigripes TaxID=182062 RepID=A0A8H5GHK7_9AGAR|nr:hypothetical protein D9758_008156 [Tetrapyrgos nigripes]
MTEPSTSLVPELLSALVLDNPARTFLQVASYCCEWAEISRLLLLVGTWEVMVLVTAHNVVIVDW